MVKGAIMMNKGFSQQRMMDMVIVCIVSLVVILCIVPFLHIIAISLSSKHAILSNTVTLLPKGLSFEAYRIVFADSAMLRSLGFTIVLTVVFTILSMTLSICAAYPLTKQRLRGRSFILLMIIFTMLFSGGLIPNYLLVKELGLLNHMFSLILPGMISAFYLIILKTFFSNIPSSLEESAYLDGCSHFSILIRIIIPLSLPVLATLSLFYAVNRWNGFMDALFYITNSRMYPLQLKLYQVVMNSMVSDLTAQDVIQIEVISENLKAASIMFATVPILLVYPWLQRYFVSGVMLGAVKG